MKYTAYKEKVFIKGDGKRLYRVFENLISNIVKYSMENTRVYIDIIKEDDPERDNKLNYILKVITQFLSFGQNKSINSVYLPSFKTSILNNFSIECNEVIFTENTSQTAYEFENNISS